MVLDIHRNVVAGQEGTDSQHRSVSPTPYPPTTECSSFPRFNTGQAVSNANTIEPTVLPLHSIPTGEFPPPPPRACFGRDELIEKIIGLAENLTPIALIGAGGIGKTSIALTILHHDRIKERFGENRRFIRCDQFPASQTHFLGQLSKAIGAGVENLEDLTPLRPFLSSRNMIVFLDNAEYILDPQGTNAQEVYAVVEELAEFNNICLGLTSRISTIPPTCKSLDIPTLSMEAACDTFYSIYKNDKQPNLINNILEQLDFHPLSVTLLATVAHHNRWSSGRLSREWEQWGTGVLQTEHNRSLAATIELSLASPMFQGLGPDARELLGVVAFFPQGINENNLNWLFPPRAHKNIFRQLLPTTSNRRNIFDKFCVLSLTYQSNGFTTMLAPLRDYLRPKDPALSPLLCMAKKHYFRRLSVDVNPGQPGFEEARWIISEDVNVEHLLDVFTSIDTNSAGIWNVCAYFMGHLYWHKTRLVMLGPKIEGLPDDHRSKPECLLQLSRLFNSVGNCAEYKRLLICTLRLQRERGDSFLVAETLRFISDANRNLGLYKEGTQQVKEALEIYKRFNNTTGQARSWQQLAWLLYDDKQPDAAEEAALQAIDLISDKGDQFPVCECYRILGKIFRSKGQTEEAINHFKAALRIATTFNWGGQLFWIHHSLAQLSSGENRFDDAHAHIKHAMSYAINDRYRLGRAMELQARFWYKQHRFKEARSGALRAANVYEKIGASGDVEACRVILRNIEEATNKPSTSY